MERDFDVHNTVNGGIIALVPTPASSFRISARTKRTLARLAKQRGKSMSEMIEVAILHLDGTFAAGQPVYMNISPDDDPKSHKRGQRVA